VDFEMPSCGGCRTCEMACSFKHTGWYQPSISSLTIGERENASGFTVSLAERKLRGQLPCDGCAEMSVPLCMQFCPKREELRTIIDSFLQRKALVADAQ
jgi:Fe-S-cluster-containing dehydrogenase component